MLFGDFDIVLWCKKMACKILTSALHHEGHNPKIGKIKKIIVKCFP